MPQIVLGIGGGIAAYKVASLLRLLTESGHEVTVVPTRSALRFVGEPTWAALSGRPVHTEVWADAHDVPHVQLGRRADLVVVAPATADLLSRAAHGRADDLLTATLLTARCPIVMAPAMHTEMWEHPATMGNVAVLRGRGVVVLDPRSGRLTGADSGPGRLPEPEQIAAVCAELLDEPLESGDLAGRRVVVSAGGTREPLDPVRYLGNRSSGRQGYALAERALARGAAVTLVSTATSMLPAPSGVRVVPVETAEQLRHAVLRAAHDADAVVMAAAVADYRPVAEAEHKIKKDGVDVPQVRLERTPDVLAELCAPDRRRRHPAQVLVGFAAETGDGDGDVLFHARAKLRRKGCDLLVANDVAEGRVFGSPDTTATILSPDGAALVVPPGPKTALADAVWDAVRDQWVRSG
ncbi:MAG: bifunctional phosphopantothenoylcysteine decarboxylase/phosphopantothenate--cysteine ligase CoaBC [Angustibacter sp.]